jgi:hypothetical protein
MRDFKTYLAFIVILTTSALIMAGCGSPTLSGNGTGTIIRGIASKGLIKGGTVTIFALTQNGSKGDELGTALTDLNGAYSVDLGSYTGNVLVEITGGHYVDEVTDADIPAPPLSAALTNAEGNVFAVITPLTDIAVKCAEGILTTENIEGANRLVGTALGVVDIVGTIPYDTRGRTNNFNEAHYGLVLASISQIAATQGEDASSVIKSIAEDLSEDHKLDLEGQNILNAYGAFIKNSQQNQTGIVEVSAIVQAAISYAIDYNPVPDISLPPPTNLAKAKKLVTDLRNTALSIYNYENTGLGGIVETPFKNLSEELTTRISVDLKSTIDRVRWIADSVKKMSDDQADPLLIEGKLQSGIYTFTQGNLQLEVVTEIDNYAGFNLVHFTVKDITNSYNGEDLDYGSLSLDVDVSGKITSGVFVASMSTPESGHLTASANYTATYDGDMLADMTLTGSLTAPGGISLDFSEEGRKLYATFAPTPAYASQSENESGTESENESESCYPTSIFFSGRITTATARMDGTLNIGEIDWNPATPAADNSDTCYASYVYVPGIMPRSATFEGTFREMKNGSPSGVIFYGKIKGDWENAAAFDYCSDVNPDNFPIWHASFDGNIIAPQRPTIVTHLGVSQTEYQMYDLFASYRRTDVDGTVVFLIANGSYDNGSQQQLLATLYNQDMMMVTLRYNDKASKDDKFQGDIRAVDGAKMADLYTMNGMPTVKYTEDDYIETIF